MIRRARAVCALLVLPVGMAGCLERKEHLTIAPNGGVWYVAQFRSDSLDDIYQGDAIPTPAGGWAVEQTVEREDDGKEIFKLLATASIDPRSSLPSSFAGRGDSSADLALQFPTTVRIEQRDDGTYYHFHRTYTARLWVFIQNLQQKHLQKPLAAFEDIDEAQWNDQQRTTVVQALAAFESEKALVFARAAFLEAAPDSPQDGWLHVQDDLRQFVRQMDYADLAQLLVPRPTQEEESARQEIIQAEVERFARVIDDRLEASLRTLAGLDDSRTNAFASSYKRQKAKYQNTQDLQDDKFEITVTMPGRIVAHNAEGPTEGVPGSATIRWTFDGSQLNDCALELIATSFVPNRN